MKANVYAAQRRELPVWQVIAGGRRAGEQMPFQKKSQLIWFARTERVTYAGSMSYSCNKPSVALPKYALGFQAAARLDE